MNGPGVPTADPTSLLAPPARLARRKVSRVLRAVLARPSGAIGLGIVAVNLALLLIAPALPLHDPLVQDAGAVLAPPSWSHPFGTDHLGRDVLARTLHGGRAALVITGLAAILAVLWGAAAGIFAALRGGLLDEAIVRFVEAVSALPYLLFLLLLAGFSTAGDVALVPALALFYGTGVVRVARAAASSVVSADYVVAARVRGEPSWAVLRREVLPNVSDVVVVDGALRWSAMLLGFSSLSFLGFGVAPPTPDWGLMIAETRHILAVAPWAALWPCAALAVTIIGLNLSADAFAKAAGLDRLAGPGRTRA